MKTHHNLRLNEHPNSTTAKIKKKGRPFERYHLNNNHYVIKLINSLITQKNCIPLIFSKLNATPVKSYMFLILSNYCDYKSSWPIKCSSYRKNKNKNTQNVGMIFFSLFVFLVIYKSDIDRNDERTLENTGLQRAK